MTMKMKTIAMKAFVRLTSMMVFLVLISGCANNYVNLFDGKTLDGWESLPAERISQWKVENGEIIAENPDKGGSVLWTSGSYKDFEVELEYITLSKSYDTGLFLRGPSESHQVQIGISGSLKRDMTGCIYAPSDEKGSYPGQTNKIDEFHKVGEWNHLKVIMEGKRIQTILNGEPFVDYEAINIGEEEGPIGLQLHPGIHMNVKFRNIRIREIPGDV